MVSEFWFVAFLTSYIPKSAFRPLWSYQVGKNFGEDLRTSNQCNPVTKLPQKPWRTSRNSQLLAEISRGHLNTDDDKKTAKNYPFSPKKMSLKTTSGEFLGMYELDFSCSSILHQLWTHIGYFKGKEVQLIFHPGRCSVWMSAWR